MIEKIPLKTDNQESRPARVAGVQPVPGWSIGTLSYTRTQLAALFGWLLCGDFAWQLRERAVGTIATLMLIVLALIYGAGMTLLCLKVKEGSYPPPPAIDHTIQNRYLAAAADYFRETFSFPFYRWLYLAIALWAVSGAGNTFLLFFAKSLNISLESYGWYSTIVFVPLIGAFLDAMHHDYRLICFSAGGFGLLAVAALLVFHGKFMRLGGPQGYVPPE